MKITPALERLYDGSIGAPVVIKTKKGLTQELFPLLDQFNQLKLSFKHMPFFNMASTFLTTQLVDKVADLDIVEKIYVDWPVRIPEIPVGFAISNFVVTSSMLLGLFGNRPRTPSFMDRNADKQWVTTSETREFLEVDQAKADMIEGNGTVIGVVDSDGSLRAANHRQFSGKNVSRYIVRKMFQTDTNGHGTHVATTIGGMRYSPFKNIYVEGMAPRSDIMLVKCLLTPIGTGSTSDCIKAMNMALEMGADVLNLSLGSECNRPEEDPFIKAMEQIPEDKIVCAASGNEGANRLGSPAISNKVLSVGAMDIRTRLRADFSNTGPELDFVMPGVNIFSGIARETLLDITGGGPEGFSALSGTSMATPHMTGMIALAYELMGRYGFIPTTETFREIGARYGKKHTREQGYGPLKYDMIKRYVEENLT